MGEIKEKLKSNKNLALLAVGIVLGLILIFAGNGGKKEGKVSTVDLSDQLDMTDKYISTLEIRVCEILSRMDGISDVSVIITADSCVETVYAQNGRYENGSLTEKEYVIIDVDGNDAPVVVKLVYPKIRGIAVVCRGGSNPVNKEKIIGLLSSLFDISANKVYVSG